MQRLAIIVAGCVLMFAAAGHAAEQQQSAPAKQIQFSDLGGVKAWRRGDKDTVVYVQAKNNDWYRVDTYETCMKYVSDKGIRFVTELDEVGDRVSKVIVDKYICTVLEMTKVDAPPPTQAAD